MIIGIVLVVGGGVAIAVGGLGEGTIGDGDVLLLAGGAAAVFLGIRMFVKGAFAMILLVAAVVAIVAAPFGILFN
jgi:hypothetical protein